MIEELENEVVRVGCKQPRQKADVCPYGYCRECHKRCDFDDCCNSSPKFKIMGLPLLKLDTPAG